MFLGETIVMVLLVAWLFIEMQRDDAETRRRRRRGYTIHREPMPKELRIYLIITSLFALSYIGRFIINKYFSCSDDLIGSLFDAYMVTNAVYALEGASMSAIMLNHLTIVETEPKRRDSSFVIEEGKRESTITGLIIMKPDDTDPLEQFI